MKLKKSGIFIAVTLCSGIMLIPNNFTSKVYAAVKSLVMVKDTEINQFSAGVKIDVTENFTPPENWDGDPITKQVSIPNNGRTPAFIRVAIIPRWVDKSGNPWPGDVSDDVVKINYTSPSNWTYGNDGYYYYNEIVKAGDSTSNIIESVSLDTNKIDIEKYKNKKLIVDVNAEAIEASEEAYTAAWPSISDTIKAKLNALLNTTSNN